MSLHKAIELVGRNVRVTNPNMQTSWTGKAVAFTEVPTLLIELEGGFRLMLPAAWAVDITPVHQSTEGETNGA